MKLKMEGLRTSGVSTVNSDTIHMSTNMISTPRRLSLIWCWGSMDNFLCLAKTKSLFSSKVICRLVLWLPQCLMNKVLISLTHKATEGEVIERDHEQHHWLQHDHRLGFHWRFHCWCFWRCWIHCSCCCCCRCHHRLHLFHQHQGDHQSSHHDHNAKEWDGGHERDQKGDAEGNKSLHRCHGSFFQEEEGCPSGVLLATIPCH